MVKNIILYSFTGYIEGSLLNAQPAMFLYMQVSSPHAVNQEGNSLSAMSASPPSTQSQLTMEGGESVESMSKKYVTRHNA